MIKSDRERSTTPQNRGNARSKRNTLKVDLCFLFLLSAFFCRRLNRGANWATNQWPKTHGDYTHGSSLADDFHTYGLLWDASGLYTYIDSDANKVLRVSFADGQSMWEKGGLEGRGQTNPWEGRPNNAPFDQKFFLIMNVVSVSPFWPYIYCTRVAAPPRPSVGV